MPRDDDYLPRREAELLTSAAAERLTVALAAHEDVHEAERRARDKAEANVDRRLEGMNEMRAQLNAQASTFVTRDMLDTRLRPLENLVERDVGRTAGSLDTRTLFLTLPGIAAALLTILLGVLVLTKP